MDGVTILNSFEVVTETTFSWQAFWIGALIGVGIALVAGIIFGLQEQDVCAFLLMFGVLSVVLTIIIGCFGGALIWPDPVAYETHYEVSISEDVSMQEFMSTYEILETRGSIYTVREK